TRGAVSIGRSDRLSRPADAAIWGLGRVVGLEHPERWGGLIDLDSAQVTEPLSSCADALDPALGDRLAAALSGESGEDQLAVRPSGLFVPRLVRAPGTESGAESGAESAWTPSGTILITGGTGALGAHVARWLAGRGVDHLVLTSRRGADAPGAAAIEAELTALGARVTVAACDVADRDALAALIERLREAGETITAAVHAAGITQQTAVADTTWTELCRVANGKIAGAQNLHDLLGDELAAFVVFASIAGIWGSGGQGIYAAANAFLDALAVHRRGHGRVATSVAWGVWDDGMAADSAIQAMLRKRGLAAMAPQRAIAALAQAVDQDDTAVTVADVDWSRFAPAFAAARTRPLLGDLPEAAAAMSESRADDGEDSAFVARIRALAAGERTGHVIALVQAEAAAVLGHAEAAGLDPNTGFSDLGLDSLMAVELRKRLRQLTGVSLPATLAFDYPTPVHVADFILDQLSAA
ncbi:MAG: beta-ketoacyl reductase, partial [Myxococcota bacterium]